MEAIFVDSHAKVTFSSPNFSASNNPKYRLILLYPFLLSVGLIPYPILPLNLFIPETELPPDRLEHLSPRKLYDMPHRTHGS